MSLLFDFSRGKFGLVQWLCCFFFFVAMRKKTVFTLIADFACISMSCLLTPKKGTTDHHCFETPTKLCFTSYSLGFLSISYWRYRSNHSLLIELIVFAKNYRHGYWHPNLFYWHCKFACSRGSTCTFSKTYTSALQTYLPCIPVLTFLHLTPFPYVGRQSFCRTAISQAGISISPLPWSEPTRQDVLLSSQISTSYASAKDSSTSASCC